MRTERTLVTNHYFLGTVLFFLGCGLLGSPTTAQAQFCQSTQGYNMVWGTCPGHGFEIVGSPAFIDASAWCPSTGCDTVGVDFCQMVRQGYVPLADLRIV